MSKEDVITVKATVVECLPNANFKLQLEEQKDYTVIGSISGKIRKNNIKIMLGDVVDLEMTPYDLHRGRIVYRYK
tara:strand:- start:303 stop:527 length:225 start_codon:yes stop_codon:yes gene_type:complete